MILSIVALAACVDPNEEQKDEITITVKLNLEGNPDQTFTVEKDAEFYSKLSAYVPQDTRGLTFAGWIDDNGVKIDGNTRWDKDGSVTAQWQVTYTEEIWVEQLVDGEYKYVLQQDLTQTRTGTLGSSVTMQTTYNQESYSLNTKHVDSALSVGNLQSGTVLRAYYSVNRHTIVYVDSDERIQVVHGQQHTIRTPSDKNVIFYCTDANGNGFVYEFGQVVSVTNDLTLFPITVKSYSDANGSEDMVEIRPGMVGLGSATLIKDGKRYAGFVNRKSDSLVEFDVNVRENDQDEGVTYHGKLLDNDTFVYRNDDECGTYLFYNPLFLENNVSIDAMLALDGYGIGALSFPTTDGTGRIANYYVEYAANDDGDYDMRYFLPAEPSKLYEGNFKIMRQQVEGLEELEGLNIAGYFMLCGYEEGGYIYTEYGQMQTEYVLLLDGYGNAVYYYVDGEAYDIEAEGIYIASDNYTDEAPEYVFCADSASPLNGNIFILFEQRHPTTGETYYFFSFKHDEAGTYFKNVGSKYPQLYLDGYGYATYISSDTDEGSLGAYTVQNTPAGYEVLVSFIDDNAGTLRAVLDRTNQTFSLRDNNFRVDSNGVLTEYLGNSAVIEIPQEVDGVTVVEIADGVFNTMVTGKNFASVTLPATITAIGERAFQNDHTLRAVYISATTPPTVGANAFHWMRSDLIIVVPDGCEQAYREAWTEYADFITSEYELAHKPLFEIKDGVLKSYNPADELVTDIEIPDEVNEIANGVFAYREYIASVNLNNVTVIGSRAFENCVNLTSVTFNANTVSIGSEAFFGCAKLTEVNLYGIQTIGDGAFNGCYLLTKVDIGSSLTSVGSLAFARCALEVDEDDNATAQNELILTIAATTAPQMSSNVFQGSAPRIYVSSYDVGLAYARDVNANWALYAKSLRVKAEQNFTFYSKTNLGDVLTLGDRADIGEGGLVGLYKWQGTTLYVAWFERSGYEGAAELTVITQQGYYNAASGTLTGLYEGTTQWVFVEEGKQITYAYGSETLKITFGEQAAVFNGNDVTLEIGNNVTRFTYQGYVYQITLFASDEFTYSRTVVTHTETYTALDGSTLTVTFGQSVNALGTLKNVDGAERSTEVGWRLTENADGSYTWTFMYSQTTYRVTATFNEDNRTFTYSATVHSSRAGYKDETGNILTVTTYGDGRIEMRFDFKTANGLLSGQVSNISAVEDKENTYRLTITTDEPSDFEGSFVLTINPETGKFALTKSE